MSSARTENDRFCAFILLISLEYFSFYRDFCKSNAKSEKACKTKMIGNSFNLFSGIFAPNRCIMHHIKASIFACMIAGSLGVWANIAFSVGYTLEGGSLTC